MIVSEARLAHTDLDGILLRNTFAIAIDILHKTRCQFSLYEYKSVGMEIPRHE